MKFKNIILSMPILGSFSINYDQSDGYDSTKPSKPYSTTKFSVLDMKSFQEQIFKSVCVFGHRERRSEERERAHIRETEIEKKFFLLLLLLQGANSHSPDVQDLGAGSLHAQGVWKSRRLIFFLFLFSRQSVKVLDVLELAL